MKLIESARAALPGEEVLAAGIFRPAGSMAVGIAGVAGFGLLVGAISQRRRVRQVREASGLPFKQYIMLVLSRDRLHVFDAKSKLTGWRARRHLASWDRSAVRAETQVRSATIRLTLTIPSERRVVELEAPKSKRETAGKVIQLLQLDRTTAEAWPVAPAAASTAAAPASTATPAPPASWVASRPDSPSAAFRGGGLAPWAPSVRVDTEASRRLHAAAGWLAIAGGLTRLLAYLLPWAVLSRADGLGGGVTVSGLRLLNTPVFSLVYSVAAVVVGVMYLQGRRETTPRLMFWFGVGAIVVTLWQFLATLDGMHDARVAFQARGLAIAVSLGFGVIVEWIGAFLVLASGLTAARAARAMAVSPPA